MFVALLGALLVAGVVAFQCWQQRRLGRELRTERRAARIMQRGLLQASLPEVRHVTLDASYVPAGRAALVGGDWYDVYELRDGRIMFSIGDVAGHGIEAAIVMCRARAAIVALGAHATAPSGVLARANDVLIMQHSKMTTAVFGYVDPRTRSVVYASAGHPPPLIADAAGNAVLGRNGGLPLGLLHEQSYVDHRIVLDEGGSLFLYTDGFTERTRDILVGERALLDAVPRVMANGTVALARRMHRQIFGDSAPGDDAAMLTIAFAAAPATATPQHEGFEHDARALEL